MGNLCTAQIQSISQQNDQYINPQNNGEIIIRLPKDRLNHKNIQQSLGKETKQRKMAQRSQQYQGCLICLKEINKKQMISFALTCGHIFCQSCLSQHIRSCIRNFIIVLCPDETCNQYLTSLSPHIRQLSSAEQDKYKKIIEMDKFKKDPFIRNCPIQKCGGFINIKQHNVNCSICEVNCCNKCFNPVHDGQCDEDHVKYLQKSFKYKRCKQCKMIIQKSSGCDHISCRCGHQFCYICGQPWTQQHNCQQTNQQIRQHPRFPYVCGQMMRMRTCHLEYFMDEDRMFNNYEQQPHQQFRHEINPPTIIINPQDNLHAPRRLSMPQYSNNQTCFVSILKIIALTLMIIIAFPFDTIIGVLFTGLPIYLTIGLFFKSLVVGVLTMVQECSLWTIILGNIFLLLYYTFSCFFRAMKEQFCDIICKICKIQNMMPITHTLLLKKPSFFESWRFI